MPKHAHAYGMGQAHFRGTTKLKYDTLDTIALLIRKNEIYLVMLIVLEYLQKIFHIMLRRMTT